MFVSIHDWKGVTRVLIADEATKSSVQLEIGEKPFDPFGCKVFLFDLWVDKEYRGNGIGDRLLDEAEKVVRQMGGYDTISLEQHLGESPMWVRRWYKRRGYEVMMSRNQSVLMHKKL